MWIKYKRDEKMFRISTKNTLYAFELARGKYLVHRYYGKKIGGEIKHIDDDPKFKCVSFSPYRSEDDINFSFDSLPLEYSYFGSGDFKTTSLRIKNKNGDSVTSFEYVSHKIFKGRKDIPDMPCGRVNTDDEKECAETLDIKLIDKVSLCELHLYYTVFPECNVISRYASVKNNGDSDVVVEKLTSICLDIDSDNVDMVSLAGSHNHDREYYQRVPLIYGNTSVFSRRGASSHHLNPFIAVCDRQASENKGDVYGFNFVYSGSFLDECECDQMGRTRVQIGLGSENFAYRLKPGETVFSPEGVMTYSSKGFSEMTSNFHDFVNGRIVPPNAKNRRPVVLNSWEAFYFDINEDRLVDFAKQAAENSLDMLVMDDGWFGKRNSSYSSLGDWFVNKDKFRKGLEPFIEKVKKCGIKFGIWIEPEMINEESELYKNHSDFCVGCKGREVSYSRHQRVLDMTNSKVLDYLKSIFRETFKGLSIDYFKWDMNRNISEPGSLYLDAKDMDSFEYRYIKGVYALFDWFTKEFPCAIVENCSGGGGRYDLGMMYYTPQIWTSDDTNARNRTMIQCSSLMAYPASVMSCHVSDPKNDMHELDLKYKVAVNGVLGYEFDILSTQEKVKKEIANQIKMYKKFDTLILQGRYRRISNPFESDIYSYYFTSEEKDSNRILLSAVKTDGSAKARASLISRRTSKNPRVLRLPCADKNAVYTELFTNEKYSGEQLRKGIEIGEFADYDYDAKLWYFEKN